MSTLAFFLIAIGYIVAFLMFLEMMNLSSKVKALLAEEQLRERKHAEAHQEIENLKAWLVVNVAANPEAKIALVRDCAPVT